MTPKADAERVVKDIRRATLNIHGAEEEVRIVMVGLRGKGGLGCICFPERFYALTRVLACSSSSCRCGALWSCGCFCAGDSEQPDKTIPKMVLCRRVLNISGK